MDDAHQVLLREVRGGTGGALRLPHEAEAVPGARRALSRELRRAGVCPEVRDDVALVVSELLGNAVRHAPPTDEGGVLLRWTVGEGSVDVAVVDGGGGPVRVTHAGPGAVGGRGMQLVDSLARAWGTADEGQGRRAVWASITTGPLPLVG